MEARRREQAIRILAGILTSLKEKASAVKATRPVPHRWDRSFIKDVRRVMLAGVAAVSLLGLALAVLPAGKARAAEAKVQMAGTVFLPTVVNIEAGDRVTWENKEASNYPVVMGVHNIISDDNAFSPSPPINPGESWSLTFYKPGTFVYHCGVHPTQMRGTINVGGTAKAEPSPSKKPGTSHSSSDGSGGVVRRVTLTVAERDMDVLGVPLKWWTYNGTVPGTTIRANVGDTLEIELKNPNNVPHAIHTHFDEYGMSSDGSSMTAPLPVVPHQEDDAVGALGGIVPGLAQQPGPKTGQNPVGPYEPRTDRDVANAGGSYVYRYKLTDPGTSWYHCHVFEATDHIEKGLFGMIVVYPKGWTWKELPPDPRTGNTKAWVTTETGERIFDDVVIVSERSVNVGAAAPADSSIGLVANGGAAGGPFHLGNGKAWNDPYIVGPVRKGQRLLLHVGNIGESIVSWHMHGHHFWRLEQFDSEGAYHVPGWFTRPIEYMHTKSVSPGEIFPLMITANEPGFWFNHDHVVPQAYLGMVPWLHVLPPENAPAAAAAARKAAVKIVEPKADDPNSWRYEPNDLSIRVGDSVSWSNAGKQDHSVTSDDDSPQPFDSGVMKAASSWDRTFAKPGVYGYHCSQHPWMKGIVTVAGASGSAPAGASGGAGRPAAAPAAATKSGAKAQTQAATRVSSAASGGPSTIQAGITERDASTPNSWVFEPSRIPVKRGDAVVWTNRGKMIHTVTSTGGAKVLDSGNILPGGGWRFTFKDAGTFPFMCALHPWMKGEVVVTAPALSGGSTRVLAGSKGTVQRAPAVQQRRLAASEGDAAAGWKLPLKASAFAALAASMAMLTGAMRMRMERRRRSGGAGGGSGA